MESLTSGQFSPDDRWVAYTSDEGGRPEVYVQQFPAAGGKWPISSSGGVQPRWRGDGKELFYLTLDGRVMAVELKTSPGFDAGVPKELFRARMVLGLTDFRNFRYAATGDGKRFLIIGAPEETEETAITVVVNWKGSH